MQRKEDKRYFREDKPREQKRITEKKANEKKINDTKAVGVGRNSPFTAAFKVNRSDELLEFLLRKCNTSRNNVKTLLAKGQILVNGSVVTQYNYVLAKDDEVKISKTPSGKAVGKPLPNQVRNVRTMRPPRLPFKIIYEDEDFIAVDKPAGLLSVENEKETECAYKYVAEYLRYVDKTARPFVLHRIDKETSGVLIFAKNVKIHSMLRLKWNEYVQSREYCAVVEGSFEKKEDTITSYLKENANNLMYSTNDPTGQKAITNYRVAAQSACGTYSLLYVNIETGRKNQIRVHMQLIGHPVVGDEKYGHTRDPLGRLGLHASKLEFVHPVNGNVICVRASVPGAFRKCFN